MKNNKFCDKKMINKDTYLSFANTNEEHIVLPIKGIVVEFPGLGGSSCLGGSIDMKSYSDEHTIDYGQNGIIAAYVFPGPWSWGNRGAIRIADAVVDAIMEKYNLKADMPIVVCGGSMGGLGALMYAIHSRFKVAMVAAACPCIDALDRMGAHPEFPRTYISAVASYDMELEDGLKEISPIYRIPDMPKTAYFICSDAEDEVFPEAQCDLFVEKLKEAGHDVEYYKQPGKRHGEFYPEIRQKLYDAMKYKILNSIH